MTKASLLLRFLFVGGSTTVIFFGLTYVLVEVAGLHVTLASTLACIIAVCYNYLLHYHWTFVTDAPHGLVLVRYLLMCAGAVLINALVMHFGVKWSNTNYMVVQVVATLALTCWSFTVSSIWVFRTAKPG